MNCKAFMKQPLIKAISAKIGYCLLCLIVIIPIFAIKPAYAQTGLATITGVVTDQGGALVPGASITALHAATGQRLASTTSNAGAYVINALPIGAYTVVVTAPGFREVSQSGIVLTAEESATINFQLTIGSASEVVKVESNAAALETETSSLGETVSEKEIEQLPLNGRNPGALVTLTAGVVPGNGGGFTTGVGLTNPNNTVVSTNGGRVGSVYFLLDGASNQDERNGFGNPFPNPDATQEFNVISSNPGAQYGFAAGGVVSIVTKSGTNQWHGNAFEYVRNYGLDATNWFSHLTDTLVRNQYGGSVGGPIWRNKIFIFGNYQRTQETSSSTGTPAFVPNTAELNGNFSQLLTGTTTNLCGGGGASNLSFDTGQLFQPGTAQNYVCPAGTGNAGQTVQVKTPYAGNQINPSTFSPIALAIEESLPQTSAVTNLAYVAPVNSSDATNEFTIRGDYVISDKQRLFGRVFYQKYNLPNVPGKGNFLAAMPPDVTPFSSYAVGWTDAISPNIVNNATFSYSTTTTIDSPELTDKNGNPVSLTTLGVNVPYPPGVPDSIEGFSVNSYFSFPASGFAQTVGAKTVSVSDQLSVNKGKHLIVAGVDVLYYNFSIAADWLALPLVGFTGQTTGDPAADFLTGSVDSFQQGGGTYGATHSGYWAPYLQDTYHLKSNLTINAGIRWEPFFPATITAGRIPVFVPGQQSTRYPNAPLGLVFPGDKGISDTGGVPTSPWLFSPRVGFAYQPKILRNTAIRGAFGVFSSPYDNSYYQSLGESAPFSPTYTFTYSQNGTIPFANPYAVSSGTGGVSPFPPFSSITNDPPSTTPFVTPVGIQTSFSPGFKLGRNNTWNLSVEQKLPADILLTVGYVGSHTYHLPIVNDVNPGIYASLGQRTTYPNFESIIQYQSVGNASFNALEVRAEKRLARGFTFTSNYTFSKALDTVTGGDAAYVSPIGDPFNVKWNYGISDLNHRNNWVTSFVYQTPSLSQYGRLARETLGNWQGSGIFTLQSGTPFSVTPSGSCLNGGNPSYSQEGGDRADVVPGQSFGEMQGSKSQWINQYFNTAAFECNAAGTFGNSGRNLLTGPRYNNWDLGFGKSLLIKERFNFQFRWEMFDALNTPHFSNPNSAVGGAGYGAITSLASAPRIMQGAVKFAW
ncbi:MAG: carboxypeptidase regulatory-like domain-containing protein [Acidobacteriaceae bacterium]